VTLNADIQDPLTNKFEDGKAVFKPGDPVYFRIYMKNNTDKNIGPIQVTTSFPPHLQYVKGEGTYNAKTRILASEVKILAPKEAKNMFIEGKITTEDQLATTTGTFCETAETTVTYNSQQAKDQLQYCVQQNTLGAQATKGNIPVASPPTTKKTPATGPETLILTAIIASGISGVFLRRSTQKGSS
jgi:hypothetical protein